MFYTKSQYFARKPDTDTPLARDTPHELQQLGTNLTAQRYFFNEWQGIFVLVSEEKRTFEYGMNFTLYFAGGMRTSELRSLHNRKAVFG